ncbi:MAG: hypothetical protein ACE5JX_06320 [Acidobacteriota bacterium]
MVLSCELKHRYNLGLMWRIGLLLSCLCLLSQPACIWKLWSKGPPPQERIYDVYANVVEVTAEKLVVQAKSGQRSFLFKEASVKGGDFKAGDLVHVFYKRTDEGEVITLVVRKIK